MNLIDLTDREKLAYYAANNPPETLRILNNDTASSYYTACADGDRIDDLAMMEYEIESLSSFMQTLEKMWEGADFTNPEMLRTIVAAVALKHEPKIKEADPSKSVVTKESYESIAEGEALPTFVYEF